MIYKHYNTRPATVTPDFVTEEYTKLISRIGSAEAAQTSDAWIELYNDWNALNSFVMSEGSRINHELSKNMADPGREAKEKYFLCESRPLILTWRSTQVVEGDGLLNR